MLIVPMMVSYDRIYEGLNIATEMMQGERRDYTLMSTINKIWSTSKNSLGHIFVKYLDPISLDQYFKGAMQSSSDLENSAQQLTDHLMEV